MTRTPRLLVGVAMAVLVLPAVATAQSSMDNMALQTKVKAKLMTDDFMEAAGINLETSDGVVQLGGFIDDEAKGKKAAELVAGVEGVKEVDNQLHQKSGERTSGQVIDDGTITTMVKAGLADADLGTAAAINVDTYNGVVLLTGFVDSDETAKLAEKYASEQDNVNKVINGIYVRK